MIMLLCLSFKHPQGQRTSCTLQKLHPDNDSRPHCIFWPQRRYPNPSRCPSSISQAVCKLHHSMCSTFFQQAYPRLLLSYLTCLASILPCQLHRSSFHASLASTAPPPKISKWPRSCSCFPKSQKKLKTHSRTTFYHQFYGKLLPIT